MRRSQSLSRALMRSLSRWRLWEYAPAMLRHMPEQRDSGVSQHLKKKLSSKTTFRWRRRRPLLRRASGDCWSRVLWARGEARAGRRGEARRQVGRPHRIWADRPLQGLQVGTIIRRVYECFFSKIVSFFQILWIWKLSNVCSTPCLWIPPGINFMVLIQGNCECHITFNFRSRRGLWQVTSSTLKTLWFT